MTSLTPFSLVRQNLRRNLVRTGMLVSIVAFFTFCLFSSMVVGESVGTGIRIMAARLGADILFVPHGYDKKLQGSLLRGEPSSFYLDGSFEASLRGTEGVEKATSQVFVASLNSSCCTLPVQLIGFDQKTDFVVRPWIAGQNNMSGRELTESEIVVGSKILGGPGDKLTFFGKEFTIAARLDETGMGFDSSVFLDIHRARRLIALSDVANPPAGMDRKTFASSILVKTRDPAAAKQVANAILRDHAVDYGLDFVLVAGMVSDIAARLRSFSLVLYELSGAVWLLASGALALVFSVVLHERKKEFGLLRIMGAARSALAGLIIKEAFLISASGAVMGLAAAAAVLFSFDVYIATRLQLPFLHLGPDVLLSTGLSAFFLAVITGPVACFHAALRLSRTEAYLSFREEA